MVRSPCIGQHIASSSDLGTHPLSQKCHVLFYQWSDVRLDIGKESVGSYLIGGLGITEILVWWGAGYLIVQVFCREGLDTVDFLFLFVCHARGHFSDVIDDRIGRQRVWEKVVLSNGRRGWDDAIII